MQLEYRCEATKPNGRPCRTLFFKGAFEGEISVKCHKCNNWNVYHGSDYTASKQEAHTWAPLTV